MLRLES